MFRLSVVTSTTTGAISFIPQPVLRQVHSLFQSLFTTECDLVLPASAYNTDTTPTQPRRNSNTHRTKNKTTNVVIQQNSRKLLMMDILISETRWAHKWNKIASDIKLVFYSSTINMFHVFGSKQIPICNSNNIFCDVGTVFFSNV